MTNTTFDGGGFPQFHSYHDVRLPVHLIGSSVTYNAQKKFAFADFEQTIQDSPGWRHQFHPSQVLAIEKALRDGGPGIEGFRWHHHQDHGVMQLVVASEHATNHFGGRFTTSGRPR